MPTRTTDSIIPTETHISTNESSAHSQLTNQTTDWPFRDEDIKLIDRNHSNKNLTPTYPHTRMELNTIYVLAAAVALISCLLYPLRARSVPGFPTGSYLSKYTQPFIGSLFCVTYHFNRFHDMICDVAKEFGDGVTWTSGMIGSPPFIFIGADPNIVEHVLKRQFWKYEKGEFFRSTMSVFLGSGIFNSDGAQWQQQRKTASHLFTMRSLKEDMSQVFEKNALTILARFERYAKEKKVFDIQDLYFRFTLDSFSEIAFGESAGCLSDGAEVPFATSFDRVQLLTNMRFYAPRWVWKLKRALQVGSEREITRHIRVIRDYGFSVIENVKRHRGEDRALQQLHERADLLSRFIDYAETNGSPLPSNEELLDVVLNFIIAGRDTTACLLSWATYELTRHPELQEKLYEESLQSTVIDDGEATRAVKELPLLHAFIMETLRLHPPVPSDVKECVSQDVWPDGQVVPPGAMVIYSPYLMGRSAKLWGKNAAEFDLSRWFDPDTGLPIKEPSSYKFPVFNAGLRLCLGKNVAILESTMMLSLAVRQFRFHPTEASQQATYALSVTMPIKNGLKITVEKRQHAQATV